MINSVIKLDKLKEMFNINRSRYFMICYILIRRAKLLKKNT